MRFTADERLQLYGDRKFFETATDVFTAESHTMKDHFRDYIGRRDHPDKIHLDKRFKKFSRKQCEMLVDCYSRGINIRVVGCWREPEDLMAIAEANGFASPDIATAVLFEREGKVFNKFRQLFLEVNKTDNSKSGELWVIVFPSKEYVDQIAQLIQAIVSDFPAPNSMIEWTKPKVTTCHFSQLEEAIVEWTGFKSALNRFVRHGDIVCIGHILDIQETMELLGFKKRFEDFERGGLNNMFGLNIMTHTSSQKRAVVVGFEESFWGSASGHYAKALVELGAKHLLYASKAASAGESTHMHETHSPTGFMLLHFVNKKDRKYETEKIDVAMAEQDLMMGLGVDYTGRSITVPTVVGEDETQRQAFKREGVINLDCENGHIAKAIALYNKQIDATDADFLTVFLPIHFITDYIHKVYEQTQTTGDKALAAAQTDNQIEREAFEASKRNSFRTISQAFAFYTLGQGLRDVALPSKVATLERSEDFAQLREMVAFELSRGNGRLAHEQLVAMKSGSTNRLLCLATVCQKSGFLSPAFSYLQQLDDPKVKKKLDYEQTLRAKCLLAKLHCQIGEFKNAKQILDSFSDTDVSELAKLGQVGSIARRMLVIGSATNEPAMKSKAAHLLKEYESTDSNREATVMFRWISTLLEIQAGSMSVELSSYRSELSSTRERLFSSTNNAQYMLHYNPEKGAHACLFLEAILDLYHGQTIGEIKLTLAHYLNLRNGGAETSEAYGEIVSAIAAPRIRDRVIWSIRRDTSAREAFSKANPKTSERPKSVEPFRQILRSLEKRESAIQDYLKMV